MKFLKVLGNKIRHALPVVSDFGVDVRSKWHPEYATDGDFVTALGRAAQDNDRYWNTTSKKIREYANGAFRDISTLCLS